jgi:GAF domain
VPEEDYTDDVEVSRRRTRVATSEAQTTTSSNTLAANGDANEGPLAVEDETPTGTLVESLLSIVDRVGDAQRGEEGAGDTQSPSRVVAAIAERIAAEAVPLDAALELIAASAQRLLNGSGAAIALPDNDELVCRASAGRAPKIGVRFRANAGLAREVVTKGCVVTCDNTLRDPRVNADIWRKAGIGSAISAPILLSQGTTAILEVFAPGSNAFSVAHATLLQELTELVRRVVA